MPRLSALVIRRSVIALGGGACAALGGVLLADAARPQLHAEAVVVPRPLIIDGPPTQVEAAPPPPRPRRVHRRIQPFPDGDDEYETASAPVQGAPYPGAQGPHGYQGYQNYQGYQVPQGSMPPSQEEAQMQTAEMGREARGASQDPCAGPTGPADQMVCVSPRLSAAEVAVQRLYDMDLYRTDNPQALREEQRRWRAVRDQVAAEDGPQALAELYAERMQELDGPY
jgi:hypothetical protein